MKYIITFEYKLLTVDISIKILFKIVEIENRPFA